MRWLLAAAATLITAGTCGAAFAPALLAYDPLLLVAVSPLSRHLVVAAALVPMLPLVAVASARRMLSCTVGYAIGRAYGEGGIAWVRARRPRLRRVIAWLEHAFDAAAPLVIFIAPGPLTGALAGATAVPVWVFVPCAAAGHVMWASLTYHVGLALGDSLAPFLDYVRAHVVSTTAACAVLVFAYAWVRRLARRSAALGAGAIAETDEQVLPRAADAGEG